MFGIELLLPLGYQLSEYWAIGENSLVTRLLTFNRQFVQTFAWAIFLIDFKSAISHARSFNIHKCSVLGVFLWVSTAAQGPVAKEGCRNAPFFPPLSPLNLRGQWSGSYPPRSN